MFKSESAPKGKVGTKGQKKIYEENGETLNFWSKCIFIVCVTTALTLIVFWDSFGVGIVFLELFGCGVLIGCYKVRFAPCHFVRYLTDFFVRDDKVG